MDEPSKPQQPWEQPDPWQHWKEGDPAPTPRPRRTWRERLLWWAFRAGELTMWGALALLFVYSVLATVGLVAAAIGCGGAGG